MTSEESNNLDEAERKIQLSRLRSHYNAAVAGGTGIKSFDDLPADAQTVIASFAFQNGANFKIKGEKYRELWNAFVAQDWRKAQSKLKNFDDRYGSRRQKEADRLNDLVANQPSSDRTGG